MLSRSRPAIRHLFGTLTARLLLLTLLITLMRVTPAPAEPTWSVRYGGAQGDRGAAVALGVAGDVFVAAGANQVATPAPGLQDLWLGRYGAAGNLLWNQTFDCTGWVECGGIACDADGNVYATGWLRGSIDFGGGPLTSLGPPYHDIFLVSFSASGTHRWSRAMGAEWYDGGTGITFDTDGNVVVAGYFQNPVDFGGGPLATTGYSDQFIARYQTDGSFVDAIAYGSNAATADAANSVVIDASGFVYVAAYSELAEFSCCAHGSFRKHSSDGQVVWQHQVPGGQSHASEVALSPSGLVYAAGRNASCGGGLEGTCYEYMSARTTDGALVWEKPQISANHSLEDVATDPYDNVLVSGYFSGTATLGGVALPSQGLHDILICALDSEGDPIAGYSFGGPGNDRAHDIVVAPDGSVFVVGEFEGTVSFGQPLTSQGGTDGFLIKMPPVTTPNTVAITSFDATAGTGSVTLLATFRSDLGVSRVHVYRGPANTDEFNRIATVDGPFEDEFAYEDHTVVPGGSYRYRIGVIDGDGEFPSPTVSVSLDRLQRVLEQNKPNPFNPATTISFVVAEPGHVTLSIFDSAGRLVRTLIDGTSTAGRREVIWDGRTNDGLAAPSGVYFYRLTAGKSSESKKMVLLK